MDEVTPSCGQGSVYNGNLGLRIGAIFIILATSMFGALFPILARRVKVFHVPTYVFDFAKYFGSGVIIATAFIHLLAPAFDELGNECLGGVFAEYDWAPAISMMAVFAIFLVEFFAFRIGSAYLAKRGLVADHHATDEQLSNAHTGHEHPISVGTDPSTSDGLMANEKGLNKDDVLEATDAYRGQSASAQILGVALLEFGVVLHSIIIGLTLSTTDEFTTLFIVIIFHQMFEGLGLGSRLAYLPLPSSLNWVPILGGAGYACVTPLGMAIGLGVRTTFDQDAYTYNVVSGILDAFSSGILLYTGLVELLAHEFIFHKDMRTAPMGKVLYAIGCVLLGAGLMALLGRWA